MAANSTTSSLRLELLSKNNYDTWSMQVEALLTKYDLWEYVSGSNVVPDGGDTKRDAWLIQDKKAKADLILSIQPSELKQVRGCETSRDVWLKLESIYASKGPARKATLLKHLMLQKLDDGGEVKEHMAKFFDAVDKLESMDVQINGDLLAIMLLYSLPSSFENFRCAIESRDELPSAEILKVKIIEESEARKQVCGSVVTAMVAGNGGDSRQNRLTWGRGRDFSKAKEIKCFKCGVLGHKSNVCPQKKPENNRKKSRQSANSVDESYAVSHTITGTDNVYCTARMSSKAWLLDSGCTAHLCGDKKQFLSLSESQKSKLKLASKASAEVKGKGTVHISVASDSGSRLIEFRDTLYVPDLRTNLISVAKITNKGHEVIFRRENAYVRNERGDEFLIADRRGDLYHIREDAECAVVQPEYSKLMEWHERLGHLNGKDLLKMIRSGVVPQVNISDAEQLSRCEVCMKGKMTALPFEKGRVPCAEKLKIIHSDVVGPFRSESLGRAVYFVTFIDDSTRWCEVYFLRRKSGVFEAFKMYQKLAEKQTGLKVKSLQSDNGGEYCNSDFDKYLVDQGIERRLTIPRTPQQNGVAERMNRTLLDMARCLLLQSGLSASFWSEAVATACHIRNRCPTNGLNGCIPFEKWTGEKVKVDHLKAFGSKVHVLDKNPSKDKLAQRTLEGIFVGYPRERKGFRVWVSVTRQIVDARDVRFVEEIRKEQHSTREIDELFTSTDEAREAEENAPNIVEFSPSKEMKDDQSKFFPQIRVDLDDEIPARARGRPRLLRTGSRGRPRKLFHQVPVPQRKDEVQGDQTGSDLEDDVFAGIAEVSVKDALNSEACEEWKDAIESEMVSLLKNDTWDIVKEDESNDAVGCRLVLTNKHGSDGRILRRKARLVAKGYSQRYGVNYHQTYAPVARLETLRLLLALAVKYELKIWQFDVVTAYLNGILEEKVYMRVPEMLSEMLERILSRQGAASEVSVKAKVMLKNLHGGGNSCRLKKALYGLKQAGRQWYSRLREKLLSLGLKGTSNEPCLFFGDAGDSVLLVLIYVDDILVASQDEQHIMNLKQGLLEDFEIKDLGRAKYCLGLEIGQDEGVIRLVQTGYILGLLQQYGMEDCNPIATPAEVNVRFDDATDAEEPAKCPYRELIGALMYLSVATRPDISNTVSKLATFTNKPRKCHWLAAKRVLRYLAGTAEIGLVYKKTDEPLFGFVDADWGGCVIDRRSYTGYAFMLSGATITWKSQKQRTVALSSTEAEYVSLAEAAKEALY